MPKYEVYATRWDDPHIIEELIPAKGLEFSMPLSDHGEASFSATVEPGRSFWRPSIAPVASGILIARDGVPVWSGMVWAESQSGPRTFDFRCAEWGSFFERVQTQTYTYTAFNDHAIFRDLIARAALVSGQDPGILLDTSTAGASTSDLTIHGWDDLTVERAFRQLSEAQGGPEWYFQAAGTMDNPTRRLVLGDRLGHTTAQTVLEYVENTELYVPPEAPPSMTMLGNLFPGQQPQALVGRGGGNVIAHPARSRDGSSSATMVLAIGAGEEGSQMRALATSSLLNVGYPRLTKTVSYTDVTMQATLQRHANADLADVAGLLTSYTLTTFDGSPDWTATPRGSTVRVILDTDVYGAERPVQLDVRLLDISVQVADDSPAQVNWLVSSTLEH